MQPASTPALPALEPGVTLLETDGRATGALQSLVLDHVLLSEGTALWVDARGHAATVSLADVAPTRRVLDRIRVARAFTAFQHYAIVESLSTARSAETSLVVAPALEWFYANDDLLAGEGARMLAGALAELRRLADDRDLPVVVTRRSADGLGRDVAAAADERLECTLTRFGPRFAGESFDTLVYDRDGGVQTTLAFWRRVLRRRHALGRPADAREVAAVGSH